MNLPLSQILKPSLIDPTAAMRARTDRRRTNSRPAAPMPKPVKRPAGKSRP
jgi:hypothetical protein